MRKLIIIKSIVMMITGNNYELILLDKTRKEKNRIIARSKLVILTHLAW